MTIYDYNSVPVEVELPDKPIANIFMTIVSGDETGIVTFEDGITAVDAVIWNLIRRMGWERTNDTKAKKEAYSC